MDLYASIFDLAAPKKDRGAAIPSTKGDASPQIESLQPAGEESAQRQPASNPTE
jgi:hypothetical protein